MLLLAPMAERPGGDAELCERAARGDRDAWSSLVAKHQRRVLVALLGMGLGIDDARDVSQDAWARVWAQHGAGALASLSFPGIVITQAHFLARDLLRRRLASPTQGAEKADAVSPVPPADAVLASSQALLRVQRALEQVPASKREIFRLATDENVPHADVAERVGLSTQRVKQIVWEVRVVLRAALEEPS